MTFNFDNFFDYRNKNSKMGHFQDLEHIDGLSISTTSANLYNRKRDDLVMFYFRDGGNYASVYTQSKVISENILSRFSKNFSHVFLVNSGSEANELALRLAKAYTNSKEFITFDHGYHGNTNGVLEVSPYKFNKPNGIGRKKWVHVMDCPDPFRGVDPRFQIDHIRPLYEQKDTPVDQVDWSYWDEKNLQTLCRECHKKKTKTDMENLRSMK